LTWAPDFADRDRALDLAAQLAPQPFKINSEANRAISNEMRDWNERELVAKAQALNVPVLVVHGMLDPRPHWAVDSLVEALPHCTLNKLAGVGHNSWLESPAQLRTILRAFMQSQSTRE
jgi:proline iminopeptidase